MMKNLLGKCVALLFAVALLILPLSTTITYASSTNTSAAVGEDGLTDYQREQQNLPLLQRDKLIAEPKLMIAAVVLLVWFVWKIRRDLRKIKTDNAEYDRKRAEAQQQLEELGDEEFEYEDEEAEVEAEEEEAEAENPPAAEEPSSSDERDETEKP